MDLKDKFQKGDRLRVDQPEAMHAGMIGEVYAVYPGSLALHFNDADEQAGQREYALYYPAVEKLTPVP